MDKAEFRQGLKRLLSSPIENDDLTKLIGSEIIADMLQLSIEHMADYGDSTLISRILSIFERSKYFSVLLDWVVDSACLRYEIVGKTIVLKNVADKLAGGLPLSSHLQMHGPGLTLEDVIKLANDVKKINKDAKALKRALKGKRVIHVKKSSDLMDSRLMYAGSYGTGKRR